MKLAATLSHLLLATLALGGASSCQDSFMKQTTADKTGAISRMAASVDDSGNVVASFDPSKTGTQLLSVASGAVSGAAIAIPPGSLSIPVSITVGEGVALASTTFTKQLGLTGNTINASGPSVSFTASQDVVAGNPFTLSIPFSALALTLAEVDTSNMVVMYRWTKVENGESSFEIGVIPGDKVIKGAGKVSFQTTKFGTFQVGVAETKITKTLLANTDEPPALKSCERYAAAVFPTCTADGQTGCVTTKEFTSAATEGADAKLIAGKTLGGVTGTFSLPTADKVLKDIPFGIPASPTLGTATSRPDNCGTNAQQDCVAAGTYFAATKCEQDGSNCFLPLFATPSGQTKKAVDISLIDRDKMLTTQTIGGITGTLSVTTPANCASDGATNCIATTDFRAANIAGAASKILAGQTVAGVEGNITLPLPDKVLANSASYGPSTALIAPTLPNKGSLDLTSAFPGVGYYTDAINPPNKAKIAKDVTIIGVTGDALLKPADCTDNNLVGCVTTNSFKSADLLNLSEGNIKNGIKIAGITGQYPSANAPLTGSNGVDLIYANFNSQIKSSATFQYFGSDGTRYLGTGDSDITESNIKSGIEIFGTTGSTSSGTGQQNGAILNPWDIRAGVVIGDVRGKLKTTCRNRVNLSKYNYDHTLGANSPLNIVNQLATPGSVNGPADIWDTIDDYNSGDQTVPPIIVANWIGTSGFSDTDCYSVDTLGTGDSNIWVDVTMLTSGTATPTKSNCSSTPINCTMMDKITKLSWSKLKGPSDWASAWNACYNNPYNGQTGWRLPTQKELMEAYVHGIRSAASSNWIADSQMQNFYWSGTTKSNNSLIAWITSFAFGSTAESQKSATGTLPSFVCVKDAP